MATRLASTRVRCVFAHALRPIGHAVRDAHVQPQFFGRGDHRRAAIHTDHAATAGGDFRGQRAIAAAEIKNSLVRLRREQVDERHAQIGHETRIARVVIGIPLLRVRICHGT